MKNAGPKQQQKPLNNAHGDRVGLIEPNESEKIRLETIILLNEKLGVELIQIQEEMVKIKQQNTDLETRKRVIQEEEKKIELEKLSLIEREKNIEVEKRTIKEVMEKMGEIAVKLNQESKELERKKEKFREEQRLSRSEKRIKEPSRGDTNHVENGDTKHRKLETYEDEQEEDSNVEEMLENFTTTLQVHKEKNRIGSEEVSEDTVTPLEMMPDGIDWKKKLEDFCTRNGKPLPRFKSIQNETNKKWSCKVVTYKSEYAAGAEFTFRRQAMQVSSQVAYEKLQLWEEMRRSDDKNNIATHPNPIKNGSKPKKESWAPKTDKYTDSKYNESNNNNNNNHYNDNYNNNHNHSNNNNHNNGGNNNSNNSNNNSFNSHNDINPPKFNCHPQDARFFVIKSYTQLDVINSIKYSIWTSTEGGNKKLDKAFREFNGKGPIYLFYGVTSSRQLCGVAEMTSKVDFSQKASCWTTDKYSGQFMVSWKFIKNLGNKHFERFKLDNNENKPVFFSRDTQEVPYRQGCEMLEVFRDTPSKTSLLDV